MKKYISTVCAIVLLATLMGCNKELSDSAPESDASTSEITTESTSVTSDPESAPQSPNTEENSENEPTGEPTFLIGLDGKPILTSEIVRLENTDKTAETLTPDDIEATAYCKGFTYLKEPSGIAYNSYKNPELFENGNYIGDPAENANEWKRVNVGDEICGLTVSAANVSFLVTDPETYKFPERYVDCVFNAPYCEFEGTVEIEGILQVLPNYINYPLDSGLTYFYPCESKLPVGPARPDDEKGYETPLHRCYLNDHVDDIGIFSEYNSMCFGVLSDLTCDMDGIGIGDVAYVRVILGDITSRGGSIGAALENVERLSDILVHLEDQTEVGQPAPTR